MRWILIVTIYAAFGNSHQITSKTATLMASEQQCLKAKALVEQPSTDYKVTSEVEASCRFLDDVEVNSGSAN